MFKKIMLCVMLALPIAVVAQQAPPDNDDIFAKTIDSNSPFYYPTLMMRYTAGDITLTVEDYYYLYYGFAFTEGYQPFRNSPATDRILMVFEGGEEPDYSGMIDIIINATEVMKTDPFSPSNLNFLVYAYGSIGDTISEQVNYDRMTKIIKVIESSGTGVTEKSPMHVLRFSHAADVITARGLTMTNRRVVSRTTEYISLLERDGKNKGYYFDFSRVFWNKPDDVDMPKKDRRWKINDWQIGDPIF